MTLVGLVTITLVSPATMTLVSPATKALISLVTKRGLRVQTYAFPGKRQKAAPAHEVGAAFLIGY